MLQIDNINEYPTPEGLNLTLVPAGLLPRLSAWLIDFVIRLVILLALDKLLSELGNFGSGVLLVAYFLLDWFYALVFEVFRSGMTPGKKLNNIYVCHDDGTPISMQSSLIRNLLRYADFMPFFFVSGALFMLFNKKSQRIGDMVAGTMVVYRSDATEKTLYKLANVQNPLHKKTNSKNKSKNAKYQKKQVAYKKKQQAQTQDATTSHEDGLVNLKEQINSNEQILDGFYAHSPLFSFALTYKEQEALLSFEERLAYFPKERQLEMVKHLESLISVQPTKDVLPEQAKLNAVLKKIKNMKGLQP